VKRLRLKEGDGIARKKQWILETDEKLECAVCKRHIKNGETVFYVKFSDGKTAVNCSDCTRPGNVAPDVKIPKILEKIPHRGITHIFVCKLVMRNGE